MILFFWHLTKFQEGKLVLSVLLDRILIVSLERKLFAKSAGNIILIIPSKEPVRYLLGARKISLNYPIGYLLSGLRPFPSNPLNIPISLTYKIKYLNSRSFCL